MLIKTNLEVVFKGSGSQFPSLIESLELVLQQQLRLIDTAQSMIKAKNYVHLNVETCSRLVVIFFQLSTEN